jgi:predicted DNA-binding transcriptional regulator AlpA
MQKRLRFRDLLERGIINNRPTLQNWIRERGFPPGQLTGPNSRTWGENEVEAYLASRPTAPKPTPKPPRSPGRPRKLAKTEHGEAEA